MNRIPLLLGFITETKGPVVNIMFLNEWGDLQVVPYKPNRALSMGDGQLEHALQHRSKAPVGSSNAPYHYAIFVDEFRISVSHWCAYVTIVSHKSGMGSSLMSDFEFCAAY